VKNQRGELVDRLDRPINPKGYLIDPKGNVINSDGEPLFEARHLIDDEIPKILTSAKFNK